MAKCVICGKRGLFLKVDAAKRCNDCVVKIIEEKKRKEDLEIAEFERYYHALLVQVKKLQETISVDTNPIAALDVIPLYQVKIETCEKLQTEIQNRAYKQRLGDKLLNQIVCCEDVSGFSELKEWGIVIYSGGANRFSGEKIIERIYEKLESYKRQWNERIRSIYASAEFQKMIDTIPSIPVARTDIKYDRQNITILEEVIKYSNITVKTNYEKLGSFVVIDTETTGFNSTKDQLLEVAAVRFEAWKPIEKFQTLINPGRPIPLGASEVNHITDEMVKNAPKFSEVIDSLATFVGNYNIVGHNLPFDLKFLFKNGYDFTTEKRKYYDTLEIAKKVLKKPRTKWDKDNEERVINYEYDYDVENYKLTTLCDYYQIRDNMFAHRALSDAVATGLLFKKLAEDKIEH